MASESHQSHSSRPQTACHRCGTCCRKGGPTLHIDDRPLVEQGNLLLKDMFTIRAGEMAHDNVRDELVPVATDHIKLKGSGDQWTCCHYDEASQGCSEYENRPLECRRLKCWDTIELEKIYGRDLLSREDLLADVEGLWDLVSDHQQRCSYDRARILMKQLDGDNQESARQELLQMIQYDIEIRRLVAEKGGPGAEMVAFLFGRPMSDTLKAEGLNLQPRTK